MLTYENASKLLKNRKIKKLANNTYLYFEDGEYIIRYHNTDIIRILSNGNYIINSGGFRTYSTKQRINKFTSALLFQRDYVWYLSETIKYPNGRLSIVRRFFDHCEIDSHGVILNGGVN